MNNNKLLIMYTVLILFCLTLSQKFPGTPQEWPFLYHGIILIALGCVFMFLKLLALSRINIYGSSSLFLYILLMFIIVTDIVINIEGRNALILRLIASHVFPIVFIYLQTNLSLKSTLESFAKTICLFTLINALIAWYFQFGGSVIIAGAEYKMNIWYVDSGLPRLHGLVGEPTHFGLLTGICFISLIYLYRTKYENYNQSNSVNIQYGVFAFFIFISLIISGTRNAIISTFIALMVYIFIDKYSMRLIFQFFYKLILFPSVICFIIFIEKITHYFSFIRFNSGDSNVERIVAMSNSINMIKNFSLKEFFFGIGFSHANLIPTSFNQYLDIIRNFGLIWTLLSVILLLLIIVRFYSFKNKNYQCSAYLLALIFYVLTSCFFYTPLDNIFNIVTFTFVSMILLHFKSYEKIKLKF